MDQSAEFRQNVMGVAHLNLSFPMNLFLLSGIFLGEGFLFFSLSRLGYIRHKFF